MKKRYIAIAFCLSITALFAVLQLSAHPLKIDRHIQRNNDFKNHIAHTYANNMKNYAMLTQELFQQSTLWAERDFVRYNLFEIDQYGIDAGAASKLLQSGYCVDDIKSPTTVHLFTWFKTSNDDNNFIMTGLGRDTKAILRILVRDIPPSSLAVYSGGELKYLNNVDYKAMPPQCDFSNLIPQNAPVIHNVLSLPKEEPENIDRVEYRYAPCADGKEGYIEEAAHLTYLPDGRYKTAGMILKEGQRIPSKSWQETANYCYDARDSKPTDSPLSLKLDVNGQVLSMAQTTPDDIYKKYDTAKWENKTRFGLLLDEQLGTGAEMPRNNFEEIVTPCGGNDDKKAATHLGFKAQISYPAWDGQAVFERQLKAEDTPYHGIENVSAVSESMKYTPWRGVKIHCERPEMLTISCNAAHPQNRKYKAMETLGYNYSRIGQINGWQDSAQMRPSEVAYSDWQFESGNSGCAWHDFKITNSDCPDGRTGKMVVKYERYFVSVQPNEGEWAPWRIVSEINNCQ